MASMLDCNKIQPRLSEYIDGALDGDSAWETKLHLSSCAVCSRIAEDLTATASLLSSLPTLEPSSSFESALAARLADQALKPRRAFGFWTRLTEWWSETPRLRPVVATGAVLAAVIPVVAVTTTLRSHPIRNAAVASRAVLPNAAPSSGSSDASLEDLWQEHSAYASSEPLADPSGMLASRATTGAGAGASESSL